ncbi:ZP domain-containing protein [Caerostris extrusa]|uniref:ZP domain-containing protein n=1 Tax=Caerostris extrusa TaxID=172846 RepID=A0AAV4QAR5_CAEEX|nr:ZP domain-containing protein [Caerostris extrusa]
MPLGLEAQARLDQQVFLFEQMEFQWCLATMETKVSVDCHSDPHYILVKVSTNIPFEGLVYVSERYGDLDCTAFGKKNQTTFLKVPLKGCDTHQKEPGLFMSHVTVQQHPLIVSAGDGEYEVGCKLFNGDLQVGTGNRIDIRNVPGSVSDCDAINFNGTRYPVVRNLDLPLQSPPPHCICDLAVTPVGEPTWIGAIADWLLKPSTYEWNPFFFLR